MLEKFELSTIPSELMIVMFSSSIFEVKDILLLSLVCKQWNQLTSNNLIWQRLFIKDFSYELKWISDLSFFKENYQKQYLRIQKLKSECRIEDQCNHKPGLRQAIEAQNFSEISALLNSSHYLYLEDFKNPNGMELRIDEVLEEATVDWSALQQFLVLCSSLPSKSLFVKIMSSQIWSQNPSGSIPLLILIACYADETYLRIIFKALGDELFALGLLRNHDLKNSITALFQFPIQRLELVLRVLEETFGEEKLSQFLVYQNSFTGGLSVEVLNKINIQIFDNPEFYVSSWINEAIYHSGRVDCISLIIKHIQKKDAGIFLYQDSRGQVPLYYLGVNGYIDLLAQVLELWGDDAPKFLNEQGNRIVDYIFSYKSYPLLRDLIMKTMSEDHSEFLSIWGKHILEVLTFISYNKRVLRETLQLFKENDCFSIAEDFYMNDKFKDSFEKHTQFILYPDQHTEVYGLLREFELDNSVWINKYCSIL